MGAPSMLLSGCAWHAPGCTIAKFNHPPGQSWTRLPLRLLALRFPKDGGLRLEAPPLVLLPKVVPRPLPGQPPAGSGAAS
mmetsp:Transcript_21578/g.65310  ORF Transcript_21578/g.65310 Transcript_21578/m.65310 type:complete len:80 (+) Transcript_21578:115-354(+)